MTFSKKTLTSNIAIVTLIIVLIFLADLKFKQYKSQKEIEKQTQSLQAQADALDKQNNDLNQSLQYLSSDSFKERVARQQLNYKKQGESVYGFTEAAPQATNPAVAQSNISDAQKWWNYFFTE